MVVSGGGRDGASHDQPHVVAGAAQDHGHSLAAHSLQPVLVDLQDVVVGAETAILIGHALRKNCLDNDTSLLTT